MITNGNGKHYIKNKKLKFTKKALSLYLFVIPSFVLLFVFHYIPIYGTIIAFQDFKPFLGVFGSEFIGFSNFRRFIGDNFFWLAFRNTIIINLYSLIFIFPMPVLFAVLINELMNIKFKRVIQTISYLPHFLSWVVVAGLVYQILSPSNGLVNIALTRIFNIKPIYFMTEVRIFRGILVLVTIWKSVGFSAILYIANISNIDTSLYEAAYMDGANRVKQTIHVTLPGLAPIIVLMLLLNIASMFTIDFDRIYLLQNPLVYEVSDVISTFIYRRGIEETRYGYTAAIGLVQSTIAFVTLVLANMASKRISNLGLY